MFNEKSDHKWLRTLRLKGFFHKSTKAEKAIRKLQKLTRPYLEERAKQREHFNEEIASLGTLLKNNTIDEDTHKRLQKLLEMGYEQKCEETRKKYGFSNNPA